MTLLCDFAVILEQQLEGVEGYLLACLDDEGGATVVLGPVGVLLRSVHLLGRCIGPDTFFQEVGNQVFVAVFDRKGEELGAFCLKVDLVDPLVDDVLAGGSKGNEHADRRRHVLRVHHLV